MGIRRCAVTRGSRLLITVRVPWLQGCLHCGRTALGSRAVACVRVQMLLQPALQHLLHEHHMTLLVLDRLKSHYPVAMMFRCAQRVSTDRFWDCCGAEEEGAPGCCTHYHVSFDEEVNERYHWVQSD